jgi:hypothetical protein
MGSSPTKEEKRNNTTRDDGNWNPLPSPNSDTTPHRNVFVPAAGSTSGSGWQQGDFNSSNSQSSPSSPHPPPTRSSSEGGIGHFSAASSHTGGAFRASQPPPPPQPSSGSFGTPSRPYAIFHDRPYEASTGRSSTASTSPQSTPNVSPCLQPRDRSQSAAPILGGRLEPIHHPATADRNLNSTNGQPQAPNSAPLRGNAHWPGSPGNLALPPSLAPVPVEGNQNPKEEPTTSKRKKVSSMHSSTPPQTSLDQGVAGNLRDPQSRPIHRGPTTVSPPPAAAPDAVKRTPRPLPLDPNKIVPTPPPTPPVLGTTTNDSNSTPSSSASPNRRAPTNWQRPQEQEVLFSGDEFGNEDEPSARFRFDRNNSVTSEILPHLRGSGEWGSSTTNPQTPPLHPQPRPPPVSPAGSETYRSRSRDPEPFARSLPLPSPQAQEWDISPAVNRPLALSIEGGGGGEGSPASVNRSRTAGSPPQQVPLSACVRHASTPSGAPEGCQPLVGVRHRRTKTPTQRGRGTSFTQQTVGVLMKSPFQATFDDQDESSGDDEVGVSGSGSAKPDDPPTVAPTRLVPLFGPETVVAPRSGTEALLRPQPPPNALHPSAIATTQNQYDGGSYNVPLAQLPPPATLPNQASIDRIPGFTFNAPSSQPSQGFQVVARKNVPSGVPTRSSGSASIAQQVAITAGGSMGSHPAGARFQTLSSQPRVVRTSGILTPTPSPSASTSASGAWSAGLPVTARLAAEHNREPIVDPQKKSKAEEVNKKTRGILQLGRRSASESTPTSNYPSEGNNRDSSRAKSQQRSSQGTPAVQPQEQPQLPDPASSLIEVFPQEGSAGVAPECVGPHSNMEKVNSEQNLFHLSLPSPGMAGGEYGDSDPRAAGSSTSAGAGELLRHFFRADTGSVGRGLSEGSGSETGIVDGIECEDGSTSTPPTHFQPSAQSLTGPPPLPPPKLSPGAVVSRQQHSASPASPSVNILNQKSENKSNEKPLDTFPLDLSSSLEEKEGPAK